MPHIYLHRRESLRYKAAILPIHLSEYWDPSHIASVLLLQPPFYAELAGEGYVFTTLLHERSPSEYL